jgi:hypothetical protein
VRHKDGDGLNVVTRFGDGAEKCVQVGLDVDVEETQLSDDGDAMTARCCSKMCGTTRRHKDVSTRQHKDIYIAETASRRATVCRRNGKHEGHIKFVSDITIRRHMRGRIGRRDAVRWAT